MLSIDPRQNKLTNPFQGRRHGQITRTNTVSKALINSLNTIVEEMMAGAFETSMAYEQLTLFTRYQKKGATAFFEKRKPKSTAK